MKKYGTRLCKDSIENNSQTPMTKLRTKDQEIQISPMEPNYHGWRSQDDYITYRQIGYGKTMQRQLIRSAGECGDVTSL